jgi:hypothetical protein
MAAIKELQENWFKRKFRLFKQRIKLLKGSKDYIFVELKKRGAFTELQISCEGIDHGKAMALLFGMAKKQLHREWRGKIATVQELNDVFEEIDIIKTTAHKEKRAYFYLSSLELIVSPKQYLILKKLDKDKKKLTLKAKVYV